MKTTWNYARLSKTAKMAGGPEKLVKIIRNSGVRAGKRKMIPAVCAALVGGVVLDNVTPRVVRFFKKRNEIKENETQMAEKKLIEGINKYDEEHSEESDKTQAGIES